MAMEIHGPNIEINRGNAAGLTIHLTGEDVPPDGTIALISLKKTPEYNSYLWQKRIPVMNMAIDIMFTRQDTDYEPGRYYWDVCLLYNDGLSPWTLMPEPALFEIERVIGRAST